MRSISRLILGLIFGSLPALGVPVITDVAPPYLHPGQTGLLFVNGTGFQTGAVLQWNGTPLSATLSGQTLEITIPVSMVSTVGTATLRALNPDGGTSPAFSYNITPGPVINSLSPSTVTVGSGAFTLTVTGNGFVPSSVVNWEGSNLATTYISATQLTALVPASFAAAPSPPPFGSPPFEVFNPDGSGSWAVSVQVVAAASPTITTLSPPKVVAGGPGFNLQISGQGFYPNSVVLWSNNSWLVVTSEDATHLTAVVPADFIATPGTILITVVSGGLTSMPVPFTILDRPVLSTIVPTTAIAGGQAFTLQITGQGFSPGMAAQWNGFPLATTYVDPTHLSATVPASLLAFSTTAMITVAASNGVMSTSLTFVVLGQPTITATTPSTATAGGPEFALQISGQNFLPGSVILWNGSPLSTTYGDSAHLTAVVPASFFATSGTASITVTNPTGLVSPPLTFTILGPPAITATTPATAVAGGPAFTLQISGQNFLPGAVARWNGSALNTTYVDAAHLTAPVPASLIATPGTAAITVSNPNGLASTSINFVIAGPPTITAITPSTAVAGGLAFTLRVDGTGLGAGSTVRWNGNNLSTTWIDGTPSGHLTASVPASLIASAGTANIQVVNSLGSISAAATFTITALDQPQITSLSPSQVTAGGPGFSMTLNGTGFISGAAVQWNGSSLPTTFVSTGQLTATVPPDLIEAAGSVSITVVNPSGKISAPAGLVIAPPPVVITSGGILNAASDKPALAPGTLISIFGSNLAADTGFATSTPLPASLKGTTVLINNAPIPLLFVSPLQINAQVPYETPPGTATLVVRTSQNSSAPASINIAATAPGILTVPLTNHALAQNADWSLNSSDRPAQPGQYVILYLTGQGAVDNAVATGAAASANPLSTPVASVDVKIGGVPTTAAAVLAPGMVGVLQMNVLVPAVPSGDQPIEVSIGGVAANSVMLSIQAN